MPDVDIRTEIEIARPREQVAAYAARFLGRRLAPRNRGRPSGFTAIAAPALAAAMRRANRKDLARLKRVVEAGP